MLHNAKVSAYLHIYRPNLQKEGSVLKADLVGLSRVREGEESVCWGRRGQMDDGSSIPGLPLRMGARPSEQRAPASPRDPIIEEKASDANINPNYFDG